MSSRATRSQIFIGSSTEGIDRAHEVASAFQRRGYSGARTWTVGVFEPGGMTLDSLVRAAASSDFAVLVITPDDEVSSRNVSSATPRDNVIFELGLFVGAIARDRVFALVAASQKIKLPSDMGGWTYVLFNDSQPEDIDSAIDIAVHSIAKQIDRLGARSGSASTSMGAGADRRSIHDDIGVLTRNAQAQGWRVRQTATTLRLTTPKGQRHTFARVVDDEERRAEFRRFARSLRADGLRVNQQILAD